MKRGPKWLRRTLLGAEVVLGFVLIGIICTDLRVFEPFWPTIRAMVRSIPEQESHLADRQRETLLKLAFKNGEEAQPQIDLRIARQLLGSLRPNHLRPLTWQFEWFVWDLEIRARLSRDERFALYCHLMQFSGGQGLAFGSQALFHEEPKPTYR